MSKKDIAVKTYWGAVLHHGVGQLVAFCRPSREETVLAHIIVKVLQAAIPEMEMENRPQQLQDVM